MATRTFSILRRRPGIIDLVTPRKKGVEGYRLKAASNFDQPFSTVLTADELGFLDPEVAKFPHAQIADGLVRMTFNPSNYGLNDGTLWLQLAYVVEGVEQDAASSFPPSAATLALPADAPPNGMFWIDGMAPAGASVADSLRIDLPRAMENIRIRNNGTGSLYVSSSETGPELTVPGGVESSSLYGTLSSIWVRSVGGVPFTVTFTNSFPR